MADLGSEGRVGLGPVSDETKAKALRAFRHHWNGYSDGVPVAVDAALEAACVADSRQREEARRECPKCDGNGRVLGHHGPPAMGTFWMDCPRCKGCGLVGYGKEEASAGAARYEELERHSACLRAIYDGSKNDAMADDAFREYAGRWARAALSDTEGEG